MFALSLMLLLFSAPTQADSYYSKERAWEECRKQRAEMLWKAQQNVEAGAAHHKIDWPSNMFIGEVEELMDGTTGERFLFDVSDVIRGQVGKTAVIIMLSYGDWHPKIAVGDKYLIFSDSSPVVIHLCSLGEQVRYTANYYAQLIRAALTLESNNALSQ
tara:strand:+ start:614 stop:1090 length:477 start_codon:yes stop_codon:yes gene_type:complete